jgi:hypothetical protein
MSTIPLWMVSLAAAALAPWAVRFYAMMTLRRVETRTRALLAKAELRADVQKAELREGV